LLSLRFENPSKEYRPRKARRRRLAREIFFLSSRSEARRGRGSIPVSREPLLSPAFPLDFQIQSCYNICANLLKSCCFLAYIFVIAIEKLQSCVKYQ